NDIALLRRGQDRAFSRLGSAPSLTEQRHIEDIANSHKQLFADLELSVPTPASSDRLSDYWLKLLRPLQRFSPDFRHADLREFVKAGSIHTLTGIDAAIIEDARRVAADKTVGSFRNPGALREIRRTDMAGATTIDFHGSKRAWMTQFMSPLI